MTTQISTAGNLTSDPELRFTPSGKAVANVRVAVNRRIKQGDNWVDAEAAFYDVTLWESAAELAAESLRKGDRVIVVGELHTESWTDADGVKRTKQVVSNAEIGASLRFNGLTVNRTKRQEATA